MNAQATYDALLALTASVQSIGAVFEIAIAVVALVVGFIAVVPATERVRRAALWSLAGVLLAGELVLVWFHWRLSALMVVVDPASNIVSGHILAAPWLESENIYLWALLVAVMGVLMYRQRDELLAGVTFSASVLAVFGVLVGRPLTNPLPDLIGQYTGYVQAMAAGGPAAASALASPHITLRSSSESIWKRNCHCGMSRRIEAKFSSVYGT